jgi:hypothetical protein
MVFTYAKTSVFPEYYEACDAQCNVITKIMPNNKHHTPLSHTSVFSFLSPSIASD